MILLPFLKAALPLTVKLGGNCCSVLICLMKDTFCSSTTRINFGCSVNLWYARFESIINKILVYFSIETVKIEDGCIELNVENRAA